MAAGVSKRGHLWQRGWHTDTQGMYTHTHSCLYNYPCEDLTMTTIYCGQPNLDWCLWSSWGLLVITTHTYTHVMLTKGHFFVLRTLAHYLTEMPQVISAWSGGDSCFYWNACLSASDPVCVRMRFPHTTVYSACVVGVLLQWWKLMCPLVDPYRVVPPTPRPPVSLLVRSAPPSAFPRLLFANSGHLIKGLVGLMVVSVPPTCWLLPLNQTPGLQGGGGAGGGGCTYARKH